MDELLKLRSLLSDIQNKKFYITIIKHTVNEHGIPICRGNTGHDVEGIKQDERYQECKKLLHYYYYEKEYGIKYMIKYLNLPITYPVLRMTLKSFFDIILRKHNEITDHLHKIRKEKALYEVQNKIGWASEECIKKVKIKNSCARGIQGYYYNKYFKKYVWLRSSWEYIYAKWLDSKNIIWDVECTLYKISENKSYRPDFFIFDKINNKKIIQIVEIKGYWKDKVYKYEELKKQLKKDIEFILITDIAPYCEKNINNVKEWKLKRIMNHEDKRSQD